MLADIPYDYNSQNYESFSWCVGAQEFLDLSQFDQDNEVVYTEEFDTYCIIYFCGKHIDCLGCKKLKDYASYSR